MQKEYLTLLRLCSEVFAVIRRALVICIAPSLIAAAPCVSALTSDIQGSNLSKRGCVGFGSSQYRAAGVTAPVPLSRGQVLGAVGACCSLCCCWGCSAQPIPCLFLHVCGCHRALSESCHFTLSVPANSMINPGLCLHFGEALRFLGPGAVSQGGCAVPRCI